MLLLTALSIFIPYLNSETVVPILSEYDVTILSDKREVIAIALDLNDDSALNIERYNSIKNAAIYFQDFEFSILDGSSSDYLTKEQEVSVPSIFYISKGEILASYPFPESETLFLYLLSVLTTVKKPTSPITSLSDLYCSLTDNPFTIISPPSLYNESLHLQMEIGRDFGFIDLKKVTSQILPLLGLTNRTIAFFRKEDKTIISSSIDRDSIRESTIPVYRILMPTDLTSFDGIIFSLFCDFLSDDTDDFLYKVGEKYGENVVVGYGINVEDYVSKFAEGVGGSDENQILVFDYLNGFFFNASKYFDKFIGHQFSVEDWVDAASSMLDDILSNKTMPLYLSEISEKTENSEYIQKVVGVNYEQFVMDENHDVLVLYKREGCQHCDMFYPVFVSFAEECLASEKFDFLKFGVIDIDRNSSPKKFPFMIGVPHVQIFPAKNKSNDRPLRGGRDRNSLVRLIKENCDRKIDLEAQPADKSELAMEMMQMMLLMDQISENDGEKLIDDMNKLADDIKKMEEDEIPGKIDEKSINDDENESLRKEIRNDLL